jgi:hypothetical protein
VRDGVEWADAVDSGRVGPVRPGGLTSGTCRGILVF